MKQLETCKMSKDEAPCQDLSSFKKLVLGILALQTTIVIVSLSLCVNIMSSQATTTEKLMQTSTRLEMVEAKTDKAVSDASRALAISGKSEANIAWIREGMTEMKIMFRNGNFRATTEDLTR
jgi:hypothetical protein